MDKNYKYPIFSKSAQAVGGIKWTSCWSRLALFSATTLPSLKEYMEEEISKFKALILEKPEDLLALGRRPSLFSALYRFYDESHELECAF